MADAAQMAALAEENKRLRAALMPFADAWSVVTERPLIVRHLTMAQLGELAAHELTGVHYRNAALALRAQQEPSDGE